MRPVLIKGGRVIDPSQGIDRVADLLIRDGAIAGLEREIEPPEGAVVIEALGMVVCPGFVDLHCHLREPGFEYKETIATGGRAAARGGFTTLCAMPNTRPVADNRATIEFVLEKARAESPVRVLPIGAVTKASRGKELAELAELAEAGAVAFSDDGHPVSDPHIMRQALGYSSALGLPIINHCEVPELSRGGVMNEGWVATRLGLRGIPATAEDAMVARDVALLELTGGRYHVAHISTAGAVETVRRAKERGLAVTCEVTPHHLTLTEEAVLGRPDASAYAPVSPWAYDTAAKVNPPLRSREDVEALVEALAQGIIDFIATDHAPHSQVEKVCTFQEAAFGISVLETALGSLMALVHGGRISLPLLVEKLTTAPARFLGRADLGTLRRGAPADVVVFDPEAEWTVDANSFASKGKNTPLHGQRLRGKVAATIVGGRVVFPVDGQDDGPS